MKVLINLGNYDETPTLAQALVDAYDFISVDPEGAALCSELIED